MGIQNGGTIGCRFSFLLLVKPMPPCCVFLKRLGYQRQRRSGEVIAQEVKAPRDATDEGFVGCLGQFQFVKSLVQRAYRTAQLAVAAREYQDVVHVAYIGLDPPQS